MVPRTDAVLADARLVAAARRLGVAIVRTAVHDAQQQARTGSIRVDAVADVAVRSLPDSSTSLTSVINATGVVLHTNLGRAPLSGAAIDAVVAAAGYVDVEFDLARGRRATRGRDTLDALLAAVPGAEAAMAVNNGAAALVLATTAMAGGREVLISRGEMVEIGAGFRLADLIGSTGVRIREVGSTNRTESADYAGAIGHDTSAIVKIHRATSPSTVSPPRSRSASWRGCRCRSSPTSAADCCGPTRCYPTSPMCGRHCRAAPPW